MRTITDKEQHPGIVASRSSPAHGTICIPWLDVTAGSQAKSQQMLQGPVKTLAGAVGQVVTSRRTTPGLSCPGTYSTGLAASTTFQYLND